MPAFEAEIRSLKFTDYKMYQKHGAAKQHTLIYQTIDNAMGFLRTPLRYRVNADQSTELSERCEQNVDRTTLEERDRTYFADFPFIRFRNKTVEETWLYLFSLPKTVRIQNALTISKKLTNVAGPFEDKSKNTRNLYFDPNIGGFSKNVYIMEFEDEHRLMSSPDIVLRRLLLSVCGG
jgi:hypothetical protein